MTTYTVRTDAVMQTIEAADMNAAAREFAAGEGIAGVQDVDGLLDAVGRHAGAWCWIEEAGDSGTRRGSHVAEDDIYALADDHAEACYEDEGEAAYGRED